MKLIKVIGAALAFGAVALAVSACQKKEETPGPAETMGKQIDSAVKDAGDKAQDKASEAGQKLDQAITNAKDEAKDLAQKAGEKIETAGQKIQDAATDAKK